MSTDRTRAPPNESMDGQLVILIVEVGHRREICRTM